MSRVRAPSPALSHELSHEKEQTYARVESLRCTRWSRLQRRGRGAGRASGSGRRRSSWRLGASGKTVGDIARVAQLVEHTLGKGEVTGSIPVASSDGAGRTTPTI